MHPSEGMPPITQASQEAVILYHDGVEDLILRVQYATKTPPASGPQVSLGTPVFDGSCDEGPITTRVHRRQRGLAHCYKRALRGNPKLRGSVELHWTVNARGRVTLARTGPGLRAPEMEDCLEGQAMRWQFHKRPNQRACDVRLPLSFSPSPPPATAEGATSPQSMAWVIPVPSTPTEYGVGKPSLFKSLARWFDVRRRPERSRGGRAKAKGPKARSKSARGGITLRAKAHVGPFEIQPIEVEGKGAGDALNRWMTSNGFKALPSAQLEHYVKRGWTFLAVKILPAAGRRRMDRAGQLPPLRITFASKKIVYPLKLSTHMSTFSARATVITSKRLSKRSVRSALDRGFEVIGSAGYFSSRDDQSVPLIADHTSFRVDTAPAPIRDLLSGRFGAAKRVHASILINERVNSADDTGARYTSEPAVWPEDLALRP